MARIRRLRLALIAIALAVFSPPMGSVAPPQEVLPKTGEVGSRLPEFRLKDFQGREISSNELRGKVALIDFWGTWCAPCKKEMPGYQRLFSRYGSRGLAVIGFKTEVMADTEDPVRFAKRIGVRYPLLVATEELTAKFGGIEGLPMTLLYDRQGKLRKKIVGFEYTEAVEAEVKRLL